jgi:hypothetical protein
MEETEAHQLTRPGLRSEAQKSVRERTPVPRWFTVKLKVLLAREHS